MKLFPTKELKFKLIDSQEATLDRLNRGTDRTEKLSSDYTNKSFRGMVNGNQFQLISSVIGRGALCVMTGTVESDYGNVKVEINKPFRILFCLFPVMIVINIMINIVNEKGEFSLAPIWTSIMALLMIRFLFIEVVFRLLSKDSLSRLRDVLDIEWVKE